eukprot:jgi/Mesvir1/29410/Mv26065-RA.1
MRLLIRPTRSYNLLRLTRSISKSYARDKQLRQLQKPNKDSPFGKGAFQLPAQPTRLRTGSFPAAWAHKPIASKPIAKRLTRAQETLPRSQMEPLPPKLDASFSFRTSLAGPDKGRMRRNHQVLSPGTQAFWAQRAHFRRPRGGVPRQARPPPRYPVQLLPATCNCYRHRRY